MERRRKCATAGGRARREPADARERLQFVKRRATAGERAFRKGRGCQALCAGAGARRASLRAFRTMPRSTAPSRSLRADKPPTSVKARTCRQVSTPAPCSATRATMPIRWYRHSWRGVTPRSSRRAPAATLRVLTAGRSARNGVRSNASSARSSTTGGCSLALRKALAIFWVSSNCRHSHLDPVKRHESRRL